MLEGLQCKIKEVSQELLTSSTPLNLEFSASWNELQSRVLVIIQLCQRNSNKMNQDERELLWFPLLESMMAPQRQLRGRVNAEYLNAFKELTRHLLNNMMGYISLPAILQRVVQDPAYNTGKFGEIRELIMGMFETYNYEKTLLSTTTKLLNDDLHKQLRNLCKTANQVFTCHNEVCLFCRNALGDDENVEIIVFRCGHVYHASCLGGIKKGNEEPLTYFCLKCERHQRYEISVKSPRIRLRKPVMVPNFKTRSKTSSFRETRLNAQQLQALEIVRKCQKSSRLSLIEELAYDDSKRMQQRSFESRKSDVGLKLNLSPACKDDFASEF
ncbi:Vacuolar protein sorting-associated protein 8-like protein, partial [Stegodyphus mimosarum]